MGNDKAQLARTYSHLYDLNLEKITYIDNIPLNENIYSSILDSKIQKTTMGKLAIYKAKQNKVTRRREIRLKIMEIKWGDLRVKRTQLTS